MNRYSQHSQEVVEHFAGRDNSLLIMNLGNGDGFEKLCPFLGVEIPAEPFPHMNSRADPVP